MEDGLIELSDTLLDEIKTRILDLIKDERKRHSMWTRLGRWLRKWRCRSRCCGSACMCEPESPNPMPPVIRLQSSPDVSNGGVVRRATVTTDRVVPPYAV